MAVRILFCATEVEPFCKIGGLADVVGALPKALTKIEGIETAVITPMFRSTSKRHEQIKRLEGNHGTVLVGHKEEPIHFWQSTLPGSNVPVFFIENQAMFDREDVYINPSTSEGYLDNPRRWIVFQMAVLAFLHQGWWPADILHLHEHHTGLIPAMLRSRAIGKDEEGFKAPKTILTIHNMGYQGRCSGKFISEARLHPSLFDDQSAYPVQDDFNYLKAGIVYADRVNTVSRTFAEETRQDNNFSFGLSDALQSRGADYFGILNGIDYDIWNPNTDALIAETYNQRSLEKKAENKKKLLAQLGVDYTRTELPLVGMITRLVDQKGINLLGKAINKMLTFDLQFVLLGKGDPRYHRLFEQVQMRYPSKFGLRLQFSNRMAHMIEAASDFFLIPSRYEPCGLNQLYSMRYGTIPIVRATGGLADTVLDYDEDSKDGWGFAFRDYTENDLLKTVRRATSFYKHKPKDFRKMMRRAMKQDFSWQASAREYAKVYHEMIEEG